MEEVRLTISVEEAARRIGVSRGLAYSLCRQGRLPVVRFGKRILVSKAGLAALMNASIQTDSVGHAQGKG